VNLLLKERDFRLIVVAVGLSSFGDVLAAVALTIRVHDLTGSGLAVAALLLADLVAHVALAPWAGMLVDRVESVRVLVAISLGQSAVAVVLAFTHSVPLLVGLLFLLGAGASVGKPAVLTLLPKVVGRDRTTPANAALEMARYAGGIGGPAIAGILAATLGTGSALLADAASFGVLAIAAAALRVRRPPEEAPAREGPTGPRPRRAREGFSFLWGEPVLRLAALVLTITVVFAVMDNVALVFFAKDTLKVGDSGYGALISVWTAGMVAGIFLVARHLPTRALALGVLLANTSTGIGVLAAAAWPLFALAAGLFVVAGAGNGIGNVARLSLIHQRTPDRLHGRVFAANSALLSTGQIAAVALGGVLVGAIGPRGTLLLAGGGTVAVGIVGLVVYASLPAAVKAESAPKSEAAGVVETPTEEALAGPPIVAGRSRPRGSDSPRAGSRCSGRRRRPRRGSR
jgi:MFS family permease